MLAQPRLLSQVRSAHMATVRERSQEMGVKIAPLIRRLMALGAVKTANDELTPGEEEILRGEHRLRLLDETPGSIVESWPTRN